jgi:4,5-DOPA dioxygenase extradiol
MMPIIFIGHGSPMNAIEPNEFAKKWEEIGNKIPKPKLILSISAHWETQGTLFTAMKNPRTIYDFYGFPDELYKMKYSALGDPDSVEEIRKLLSEFKIGLDYKWGLDHGTWIVLHRMYPDANIPVIQLSLDINKKPREHFQLGQALHRLREKDILILGSGNIVHNLGLMRMNSKPFPWASEFDRTIKSLIEENNFDKIIDYSELSFWDYAIPTNEHFLPLLYILGASIKTDKPEFFCEDIVFGSVSMRCVLFS